jgi:hypothetical protein
MLYLNRREAELMIADKLERAAKLLRSVNETNTFGISDQALIKQFLKDDVARPIMTIIVKIR